MSVRSSQENFLKFNSLQTYIKVNSTRLHSIRFSNSFSTSANTPMGKIELVPPYEIKFLCMLIKFIRILSPHYFLVHFSQKEPMYSDII